MKQKTAILAGIQYKITDIDGQIIFEESSGFYGTYNRFTIEWRGCGWYLVDFESWKGNIFVAHIIAAQKWIDKNYDIEYDDGVGKISLKEI